MKRFLALSFLVACSSTTKPAPAAPPVVAAVAPAPARPSVADPIVQLASRRAQLLGWLHDYREAGVFPTDALGRPASVFVDANGVRCPMAELLHKAGRDDLVEAVAKEANSVRLADVHSGPLHGWMMGSGLTQEEISLVQGAMNISFDWMPAEQEHEHQLAGKAAVRAKLEVAEMALRDNTATSLVTIVNRIGPTARPTLLGRMPVTGAVVPKTAIPRPVVVQTAPRVMFRRPIAGLYRD